MVKLNPFSLSACSLQWTLHLRGLLRRAPSTVGPKQLIRLLSTSKIAQVKQGPIGATPFYLYLEKKKNKVASPFMVSTLPATSFAPLEVTPTEATKKGETSVGKEGCCSLRSNPSCVALRGGGYAQNQKSGNNIFNLKSFNELKKDQTNINIFKNSYFDSSFNSVQSLNINLSNLRESLISSPYEASPSSCYAGGVATQGAVGGPSPCFLPSPNRGGVGVGRSNPSLPKLPLQRRWENNGSQEIKNIINPKLSAILRAIRSIRLNREEWKLIRNINLMEKKIRSNPLTAEVIKKKVRDTNSAHSSSVVTPKELVAEAVALANHRVSYGAKGELYSLYSQGSNQVTLANYRTLALLSNLSEGGASKNILLRNMKYNFLKSTLSSILKKKIRKISEVLEDKPIKNYGIFSYLKNCISLGTPMVINSMLKINNPLPSYSSSVVTPKELVAGDKQSTYPSLSRPVPAIAGRYSYPAGGVGAAGAETSHSRRQGPNLVGPALAGCETTLTPTATPSVIHTPSATPTDSVIPFANSTTISSAIPSVIPSAISNPYALLTPATAYPRVSCFAPANHRVSYGAKGKEGDNNSSGAFSILQNRSRTKLSLNKNKGRKFGIFIKYNKIIGYKFNSNFYKKGPFTYSNWKEATTPATQDTYPRVAPPLAFAYPPKGCGASFAREGKNIYIKNTYKLLFYLFKSMYCLISKPIFKYSNDKITIQLFYYLNIPKKKVFRLFSIYYINSIKKKWLALIEKKKTKFIYAPHPSLAQLTKGSPTEQRAISSSCYPSIGNAGGREKVATLEIRSKKAGESLSNSTDNLSNYLSKLSSTQGAGVASCYSSYAGGSDSTTKVQLLRPGRRHTAKAKFIKWKLRKTISRFLRKNKNAKNLLFKLRKFNLTAKAVASNQNKFKLICAILSNRFNKPVELQLIRLHHPYHDSNILVNLLSLNIKNKRKKARVAIQKIYNKKPVKFLTNLKSSNLIPAFLSGLNIKIAGRLMGEPIIPRITTKVFGKGASATGKVNYLDVARITKKNRKGSYTIKIKSGQNFF